MNKKTAHGCTQKKRMFLVIAYIMFFCALEYVVAEHHLPTKMVPKYEQTIDIRRLDPDALYASKISELASTTIGNLWDGNRELLAELSDERYCGKSLQEKLDCWQDFIAIDCAYLGCTQVPLLGTKEMDKRGVSAYYNRENETIIIDINCLLSENGQKDVIKILLHENYHHYSNCCTQELEKLQNAGVDMNLLFAREISDWAYEQEHYHSYDPEEDDMFKYQEYRQQSLETSATEYSNDWWYSHWDYIRRIKPAEDK